ncbi:MAG: ATP-binding protein [Chthonomonadales bacterium]
MDQYNSVNITHELLNELDELRQEVSRMRATELARRGAEDAVNRSEIFGEALLRSLPAHVAVIDRDGRILGTNTAWERSASDTPGPTLILGSTGANYFEISSRLNGDIAGFAASANDGLREVLAGQRADFDLIYPATHKANPRRWWLFRAVPIAHASGGAIITHMDVTRQRESEAALSENLSGFKLIFDHHPLPMWVYDIETLKFLEVNDAAVARYGYTRDEFSRMTIIDIRPPNDRKRLYQYLTEGGMDLLFEDERAHILKDQSEIDVEVVSHLLEFHGRRAVMVMSENVTEQKLLQERMLSSQKMDIVGRLASGIAHDLNSSLTAIMGFSGLAELDIPFDHPASKQLHGIQTAAADAANLLQQLLAFARRQVIEPKSVNLNGLLIDVDHLIHHIVGDQIEIIVLPRADLWSVRADPNILRQAIVNLADFAHRSMPKGGRLTIKTENLILKRRIIRESVAVEPGEYVSLTVIDNGSGLSFEVQERIFEPFFSADGAFQDVGMGLATVYGIVKQSGGYVWVSSEIGRGTQFEVLLPRSSGPSDDEDGAFSSNQSRGTETILIADDEPMVRSVAIQSLRSLGYTVLEASNGREAQRIASDYGGKVDLLLADRDLPLLVGIRLYQQLLTGNPNLKLLLIVDLPEGVTTNESSGTKSVHQISKPFTVPGLAESVRTLLDS